MKKWLSQFWPWSTIRKLNNDLLAAGCAVQTLELELRIVKAERDVLKHNHEALEQHRLQSQRAFAMLGIFIKRRHALNIDETRLQQFIK